MYPTNPPTPTPWWTLTLLAASAFSSGAADAQAPSPFLEFMDNRYLITTSPIRSFQGIAFDPVTSEVYSDGVFDRCGGVVDDEFLSDSGMAWDPVTQEVWLISTATRDVYRYDDAGVAELIFNIPLNFDVPGVGASTMDSPQGLALDETHVYVVDAGADLGQLAGNEWFKFTRDGTPVSSSGVTDFVASIDAPADDAIVDGITWCPPTSAVAPGLFLVAFEHTGIMVIDEDGFFVDDITWENEGLVYGTDVPFAFAGITVDPTTGDIYLVENDGSSQPCHVWVRMPDDEPALLGSLNSLHYPDTGCPRQLVSRGVPSGLVFGLTHRIEDGLVWGTEYNTGELIKIDPRTGKVVETVPNGGWGNGFWGITHDTERDDIYLYRDFEDQVYVIDDPDNPTVVALPNLVGVDSAGRDLAFNPDDGQIYIGGRVDGTSSLLRIDRDTGIGTVVGPTLFIGGLTYDAEMDQLLAMASSASDDGIYTVDPATGDDALFATSEFTSVGWEGLVVLRQPAATTPVEGVPSPPVAGRSLRAFPNPFGAQTTVTFDLDVAVDARVAAYDVTGRLVRRLSSVARGAGRHEVVWDGRSESGRAVPAGMYFLRLEGVGAAGEARKVFVVR